jgi:uncharacterized protein
MHPILKAWLDRAKSNKKANRKWFSSLSRRKDLDMLFHREHEAVFQQTDCLTCANCCKTTSPIFRDVDINRIAKHLGLKPGDFTQKNLHIDQDGDWVLNTSPCLFLGDDNRCSIYEVRPKACREYPHTDRKNMAQVLDLTYRNTLVCPAVARITENIQQQLGSPIG